MRWLSRLASWFLGWPIIALVSVVASVLFHLDTGLGRKLGRDMLNEFVSDQMVGTLHAGYITQLRLWHTIVKDTFVYDPDGNAIIYGETVEIGIDPIAALRGRLRFYYGDLTNGWVDLIDDGEGAPTFLAAFEAADQTPTEGEPFHAIIDNMDLRNLEVTGELLGLEGLRVVDLDAKGRMEFFWITDIEVWSAEGRIVSPFPFEASLDNVVGSVHTDARGAQVTAEASREDEHMTAEVVYRPHEDSAPEDPWDLDLFVRVEPISAETLYDVGFDWAESLKGETTGWVRLWGPEQNYRLQADLNTAGGRARIKGELPSEGVTRIEISSPGARLAEVMGGVPDVEVNGRIELSSDPQDEGVLGIEIETEGFSYENLHVPAFIAKIRARDDGIDIDSVQTRYAGGDLYLDGHVEYEGITEIHARGNIPEVSDDPNFQKYAEGIEGSAEFDLHIRQTVRDDFETKGWVRFDRFDYGAISAHFLILEGRIWGDPLKPKVDLELDGAAVRVAGYPIGNGQALLTGGPDAYTANGEFTARGNRRAEFQARVEVNEGVYRLDVDTIELAVAEHSWRGSVNNATLDPDKGLSFDRILMGRGLQRLEAQGEWLFDGPDDIRADLENFDLALLKILYPENAPDLTGGVDLHFEFRGDLDKAPTIVAEGTLTDANLWDIAPVNAAYLIHYDSGLLNADAQVDLGGRGNFTLSTTGFVEPSAGGIGASLREGVYETTLSTGAMDLTLLELLLEEDTPDVQGYADAIIRFSGPIDAPAFKGTIDIPGLIIEGWGPVEFGSKFRYEYGALLAQLRLADDEGELLETEGSVLLDLVHLVQEPGEAIEALATSPWRLSVRLPPRRLSSFPKTLSDRLVPDADRLQLAASLTLAGGAFRTRGDFHSSFDWLSDSSEGLCGSESNPRATVKAHLEDGLTEITIDGVVGATKVLNLEATSETPLEEWLQNAEIPSWPVTRVSADFYEAPTENLPYLCRYAAGVLSAQLKATGLFSDDPKLALKIKADELRARRLEPARRTGMVNTIVETPPSRTRISAGYEDGIGEMDVDMQWWNGGSTAISGKVPLVWDSRHPVPVLAKRGDVHGRADFDRMPLQAVLAWMAGVVNVEGILQGSVTAQGPARDPSFVGSVELSDGRVNLRSVGQTLEDVTGRAIFDEDGVSITDLRATDTGGAAEVDGRVAFKELRLNRVDLVVQADTFPVRQEGSIMARLDGSARMIAKFGDDGLEGELRLGKLEVDIPEGSATPQDLERHPEVFFIGETYEPVRRTSAYHVQLKIRSEDRLIIRSKDQGFYVEATAKLDTSMAEEFTVEGSVNLQRGSFQVFGKRFDIRSGSMVFDGDPEMDAKVDLVARHSLRGSNDTVTVTVSGRLSDPTIEFKSSVPTSSEAQVIALLVTGTTRQQRGVNTSTAQASQDTSNFLTGVAAGLFSASLQSQFGGFAPTFGIQQGQGLSDDIEGDTAVQVGFNVDSVLPDNLPIRGLYVEGQFVARRNEGGPNTTAQAQRPGFLIEALWPLNFVTTGTFAPPSNWSLDVTWEP
ncbi:MAG: translocation/assembly module TamB domain-containing protein [Deltaproteobacteria bacterium]|nr:translocation/assembly module TamB domain-containing protein [Deltaproteobacteria bacterium]